MSSPLPASIRDTASLENLLSEPPEYLIEAMRRLEGDVIVLGVGGKMGPTLARMARRASDAARVPRRVIGVARFSAAEQAAALDAHGIEAIRADLFDRQALARLPDAANVIYMAGRKFGSTCLEHLTWASNSYLPALVCERYASSRIVAFSTGNVYGLTSAGRGGSRESDELCPVGEYAMSCLGRERIFEHFSAARGTATAIVRLNYAVEMRYGVIADLARRIARRDTVDVSMGYFNAIWQADANAMALASLEHAASPPFVFNVAGPEELTVRATSESLARLMACDLSIAGREAPDALLSNGQRGWSLFGPPRVDAAHLMAWTADWVTRGGASLERPTHFESRDGRF